MAITTPNLIHSRTEGPSLPHETRRQLQTIIGNSINNKAYFAKAFFGLDITGKQHELLNLGGRISAADAGRRFGKSTMTLIDGVHDKLVRGGTHGHPWRGFVTGPSIDQTNIYFNEFEERAQNNLLLQAITATNKSGQMVTRSPFPRIEFKGGGILAGRSTARNGVWLRGKGADWVAVTEAAFIKDIVYNQVIRAMVADTLGRIRLESTPNGENYFKKTFDLAGQDHTGYYRRLHATIYDNHRLQREEIERIRLELPDFVWRVEYLAQFLADQDVVFPWDLLMELFDEDYPPLRDDEILTGGTYRVGVDIGRVHDYTVICVADTSRRPYRLAYWERFRGRLHTGPGGVVDRVNEVSSRFRNARVLIDATSETAVAELVQNAEPVQFTQAIRSDLLNHFEVLCQRREVELPAGWTQLRDEMRYLRRIKKGLQYRIDHPDDGFDDTVIAAALALWEAEIPGGGLSDHGARIVSFSSFS